MPTFPRNPYDISRGVLRACQAEPSRHAQRGFRSPQGILTLPTESLRYAQRRPFASSAQSFTMSSPRVFEACSTPPAFVTFVNPAAFIASSANPERRPERQ